MTGSFIDKFSGGADCYRKARPTYPAGLFEALARHAPGRDLAWDCGTGNGQATSGLAAHFRAVHATDPSAQQIARAVPADRVTYAVEPAEDVSLAGGSADLVLAAQALHWFDLDLFYAEAARVLKPGGILAAIGYDWMYVDPAIDRAVNDHLLPPLASHWSERNALLWAGYRSIPFPGEEIRLGAFAIYLDWGFAEVRDYVSSWSAARALAEAEGTSRLEAALRKIGLLWGGERRRVVMPLFVRAARVG